MFISKRILCRTFQLSFRAALPILPYREPRLLPSCDRISEAFTKHKPSAVLIVTTAGTEKRGLIAPIVAALTAEGIGYAIYNKTQPDPTVANVEEALALYREHGCEALIAVGGGSVIDCAKGVGARVAYPKKSLNRMAGVMRVLRRIPTLIAVPTTAGTGSEVTLAAVITDDETHRKYAIMSFPLIPHYAVLDPALTFTLPPHLTATTGMDALTHAVEAYVGRSTTKKTRRLALEATALIFGSIKAAYDDGQDREARERMLRASYLAGVSFSMSYVGYVHAIAHSIGGRYGVAHGLANAVIMPYVLKAYGKSAHKKLHRLAVAAGVATEADSHAEGAEKFIAAIRAMNADMGIPTVIDGILAEDIPALAARAAGEGNPLYPVPKLMNAEELMPIYRAIAGDTAML